MSKYKILYENPDFPEESVNVVTPTEEWLEEAMSGKLPSIKVFLKLKEAEQTAIKENRHVNFKHNKEDYDAQFTTPRIAPLTEEEAMEYLLLKDVPQNVWGKSHNRQLYRFVRNTQIPSDREFRNAWRLKDE